MKSLEIVRKQEQKLLKVCQDIEYRGVLIDKPYVEAALLYEEAQKRKAVKDFEKDTGRTFYDSSKLFAKIFAERNEYFPSTLKGNPSFTGEFLESSDSPTAKLINKIRFHEKRIGTYFKNFLYYADENNYIHPNMKQAGTVTGRFSYSSPNLQNCPKEDQEEDKNSPSNIRKSFIAPDDYFILSIDYSAVEYRIMLDYAGEKTLIDAVKNGVDVHQATADMLGIPRKQAKTINFGCIEKDQLVLTNNGFKKIQDVKLYDLVWDGVEFVKHKGVLFSGVKKTIGYFGLRATECHRVLTKEEGFVAFKEVKSRKLTILKGAYNRKKLWISGNYGECFRCQIFKVQNFLFFLQEDIHRTFIKFVQWKNDQLQVFKKSKMAAFAKKISKVFIGQILGGTYKMLINKCKRMEKLWGQRNRIKNEHTRFYRILCGKLHGKPINDTRFGQDKQRWKLRNWKHKICNKIREFIESALLLEKQIETYDILNCGPRHRFTVSNVIVHNCLYGIGAVNLGKQLGISEQEAKELRLFYFNKLPKVSRFLKEVKTVAENRGYVVNPFGRRYYCSDYKFSYKIANHLIQGTSADVIKKSMVDLCEFLIKKRTRMVLQVHDELMFYMHKNEEDFVPEICSIMEEAYIPMSGLGLKVAASKSNDSWSYWDLK